MSPLTVVVVFNDVGVGLDDRPTSIANGNQHDMLSFLLPDPVRTCFMFPSLVFLSFSFLSFFSSISSPAIHAVVFDASSHRGCSVAACGFLGLVVVGALAAKWPVVGANVVGT